MYSEPAVKCCFKTIDEVMCQRVFGALPLSYGAMICIKVAPVGFEPTTSGLQGCTPTRQSIVCLGVDEEIEQIHFPIGCVPATCWMHSSSSKGIQCVSLLQLPDFYSRRSLNNTTPAILERLMRGLSCPFRDTVLHCRSLPDHAKFRVLQVAAVRDVFQGLRRL